jgi:phosphatidylglycerol:prolipoprotein diacylglycerol transferase
MYPEIHIFNQEISTYLFIYALAFIVATLLLRQEFKRNNYPKYLFAVVMVVGCISGIIGAKIYYILSIWKEFKLGPIDAFFNIPGSGWYGGFILGGISIVLVLNLFKQPLLKTLDIIIIIVPISQAIGRLGCFLAGCCHGTPSNLPWAMTFPDGLYPPYVKVHPTQIYEMIICSGIFIWLWRLRKKQMPSGSKLSLYLILGGLGRFLIEFIRPNPKTLIYLTVPQIIALLGIILGTALVIIARHKKLIHKQ